MLQLRKTAVEADIVFTCPSRSFLFSAPQTIDHPPQNSSRLNIQTSFGIKFGQNMFDQDQLLNVLRRLLTIFVHEI
jgi:hypothetical protein